MTSIDGHFSIMVIPLVLMPVTGGLLARYHRAFGIQPYPYSLGHVASATAFFASLIVTGAFFEAPGIHVLWLFTSLVLCLASQEGLFRLTGSRRSWAPHWPWLAMGALAIAMLAGYPRPLPLGMVFWATTSSLLQMASIATLLRSERASSPATGTTVVGYCLGILAVWGAPYLVLTQASWALFDMELVLVTLVALLMTYGATTYVLEGTAFELRKTRDAIAAEVEARTAELQEANAKLRQLDRAKDQFLSTVSHELRTPLTAIKGYGEFLEDEIAGPLGEGNRAFVGEIVEAAALMAHKVEDLLDFARISAGTMRFEPMPIGYDEILVRLEGLMQPSLSLKGQRLKLDYPQGVCLVGDRHRLQQVLINLVQNASKFSPEGAMIRVTVTETADEVHTVVADPGIGIPLASLHQIFQAFYQVNEANTREHGGIGMGLAIVRSLVDAHQGRVEVESEPGQGSRFTVVLPKGCQSSLCAAPRGGTAELCGA